MQDPHRAFVVGQHLAKALVGARGLVGGGAPQLDAARAEVRGPGASET